MTKLKKFLQYIQINVGAAEGSILMHLLRTDGGYYHDGTVRLLGNFEDTVVEGQQDAFFAASALGVNTHGCNVAADKFGGFVYGEDGVAGILPVDG